MFANPFSLTEISIDKNKHTRIRKTCQRFHQKDTIPLPSDPISYIKNQNSYIHKLLTILARYENYYGYRNIYLTQSTLAKMLGISRQYCNYLLGELVAAGFILSNYRHKTSCEYKFSSYFHATAIRDALKHLIPSFKWLSIYLLTPVMLQAETISNFVTTQIKSPFVSIKLNQPRISISGITYDCKRVKNGFNDKAHRKKRKFVMNNPILPEIRHIPGVNFSLGQQIDLSEFPAQAIVYAAREFSATKNVKNPFGWFKVVCSKYCANNNLERDQLWVNQLKAAYSNNPKPFSSTDQSPYPAVFNSLLPINKPPLKNTAKKEPEKRRDENTVYQKGLEVYKASKPADHFIHRKTFYDEYTQKEILMELHKLEQYSTTEHMQPLIALLGEKAAYAYQARVKQDWLDKLANCAKLPKTDELPEEYSPNYNDDSIYEEIIEEPIW